MKRIITHKYIDNFRQFLTLEEKSPATIEKYTKTLQQLAGIEVTVQSLIAWKKELAASGLSPKTINTKICALNAFAAFMGWNDCRLKLLKIQRTMFREESRELSRDEYRRLIETARKQGRCQLALIIETIGATGMRVSELRYLTTQAVRAGRIEISLKGKIRVICIEKKLGRKLLEFTGKQGIKEGTIFVDKQGRPLDRRRIWTQMKKLAAEAGVELKKVFPHNLRHLFARTYYKVTRNLAELASLLGHSSIETTRIYLLTTAESHQKKLSRLNMIC